MPWSNDSNALEQAIQGIEKICKEMEASGDMHLLSVVKTCRDILVQTEAHKKELTMAFVKTGDVEIKKVMCSCGAELDPGSKLCPKCGKEIIPEEPKKD